MKRSSLGFMPSRNNSSRPVELETRFSGMERRRLVTNTSIVTLKVHTVLGTKRGPFSLEAFALGRLCTGDAQGWRLLEVSEGYELSRCRATMS